MLYLVATPIGNLADITFRAVETLRNVDRIYCEDTRRTRILLDHYNIQKPLESYHHHSDYKIGAITNMLKSGQSVAYVSDAGTPGLADPGGKLVAAARAAGLPVVPIPGPSAVTTLLSVSGMYANQYFFAGYVPTKKGRQTFVKSLLTATVPTVFFETAPRFLKLLGEIETLGGAERRLVVGRELTKQFEEIRNGTVVDLKTHFTNDKPRGELVIILTSMGTKEYS